MRGRFRGKQVGGSSWSPSQLSSLELWTRPEELGDDLSKVTNWPDQSGFGNDLKQATEANQPIVDADAFGSLGGVVGDAVDDELRLDTKFTLSGAFSIIFAIKIVTLTNFKAWLGNDSAGTSYLYSEADGELVIRTVTSGGQYLSVVGAVSNGSTHIVEIYRDGSNNWECVVDGVDKTRSPTPTHAGDFIVWKFLGTQLGYADHIWGEILLIPGAVATAEERTNIRTYLNGRFT